MLSTVELFLLKPKSNESQLHIDRANIICNANLHRKAILKNIYKFILTRKCDELPPPFVYNTCKSNEPKYYEKTQIRVYDENCEIEGYNYIPGKVHADIVEALIGAFYLHSQDLNDCQLFLYCLDILKKPLIRFRV
jgi:dsRNA-specific ribonuclease